MKDFLEHRGMPHEGSVPHSGRYPYGSGEHAYQRDTGFLGQYFYYKNSGEFKNDTEIARAMGMSTGEFRAAKSNAKNEQRAAERARAIDLLNKQRDAGYSKPNISAIAREMYGDPRKESTVRSLLDDTIHERKQTTQKIADVLKKNVDEKKYIDVGAGVENYLNVSKQKMTAAIKLLKEQGYHVENVYVEQVGTGKQTTVKTLVGPNCTWSEVNKNKDQIKLIDGISFTDNGRTLLNVEPPVSVDSKRIKINYESPKDGVIELRRGVDDISLGNAQYAQVRIAVDGTHYLKGMAMYSDDMPKGVDIIFNTNKHSGTPMMSDNKDDPQVLKMLKTNKENVFGATIKNEEDIKLTQRYYIDKDGKKHQSAINVVNEEGDWDKWSKTLSSQFLSKQPPTLAKRQLEITQATQGAELDLIKSLNNPIVKQKLLESFADDCDSKAVHLKAANLPRQASHVILPFPNMKENEVYAPNYNNGENVVLIRYPHGGKFEIPTLTVNNNNKEARKTMGNAPDAIGINPKVAGKLSGADFDGDTVLVIPINNRIKVKTDNHPAFKELQTFDPKESYPKYPGMKVMSEEHKQREMGVVSNLITDMTIKGATPDEIVRAVKHSMVVIDATKHELNYKLSESDNQIRQLKEKYQSGGASTIISRAKSEERVPDRREITNPSRMTPQQLKDYKNGKKIYEDTGKTYIDKKGQVIYRQTKSTKMMETDDAYSLTSGGSKNNPGRPIESVYAEHANILKGLANEARRESRNIKGTQTDSHAKKIYAEEVASLDMKLDRAMRNKPLERQAQLIANKTIAIQKRANPDMDKNEIKRLKQQALSGARHKVGKDPYTIDITPKEWEAIQSGAISTDKLKRILDSADMDQVKKYATPKQQKGLTPAKLNRAKSLLAAGWTQAQVAEELGISTSTLSKNL